MKSLLLLCAAFLWSACSAQSGDELTVCSDMDAMLTGGENAREGRVELCYQNLWWSVCDDLWGAEESRVLCRQLGFSADGARPLRYTLSYLRTPNTSPFLLDDVQCTGEEESLLNCSHAGLMNHDCYPSEQVGTLCEPEGFSCEDGDLRLVKGETEYEGIVEICESNQFWSICNDDSWDSREAQVVCSRLGFGREDAIATENAAEVFGPAGGPIQAGGYQCSGLEGSLTSCLRYTTNPFYFLFCDLLFFNPREGGVLCKPPNTTNVTCDNGVIRLANGRLPSEGRVELCYNGEWGTVCEDDWGEEDASVVCRQIGYGSEGSVIALASSFGEGAKYIFLNRLLCEGNETSLLDCPSDGLGDGVFFCDHSEDAGVVCPDPASQCEDGAVWLVGGETPNEGRVEMCFGNHTGTVCHDDFHTKEASVVCRQLGYPTEGSIPIHRAYFGEGVGVIFLDDLECAGNETGLVECQHRGLGVTNCGHNRDVGVICQAENASCSNGDIVLRDGTGPHSGRVEVCFNGRWGTVCDDNWDSYDAAVVCAQLNYSSENAVAVYSSYFGEGTGPIFLDDVGCSLENETILVECFRPNDPGVSNCEHSEDAGVFCSIPSQSCYNGELRLVDGSTDLEGRLEICVDGSWSTVCDNLWSQDDAAVACRQLGFAATDAAPLSGAFFGPGTGDIFADSFSCYGKEQKLLDCFHRRAHTEACRHTQDAGVICKKTPCEPGEVRLVGGQIPSEGRVELCVDEVFGTVCDDSFDSADATIVCRQLGYHGDPSVVLPRAFFGQGTGLIALQALHCLGNESTLLDCPTQDSSCYHWEDVSVLCQSENATAICRNGDLRLTDGSAAFEGNVEICFNGNWGTICRYNWDQNDARVVCNHLGYGRDGALAVAWPGYFPAAQNSLVFLSGVQCSGTEESLLECEGTDPSLNYCPTNADAGVVCKAPNSTGLSCESGGVRLSERSSGIVEVCVNGQWGLVCAGPYLPWGDDEAGVVCRQLGFVGGVGLEVATSGYANTFFRYIDCKGMDNSSLLLDCPNSGLRPNLDCNRLAAAATCKLLCDDGDARLVNAVDANEGTVEVCMGEEWRMMCDVAWDNRDASVLCFSLGYQGKGAVAVRGSFFGPSEAGVSTQGFNCSGDELHLSNCPASFYNCSASAVAGVICPVLFGECNTSEVRLVGGAHVYEGRVEVCINGHWGSVCDDRWDFYDAMVICRQLGYTQNGDPYAVNFGRYGSGYGTILLDEVSCTGNESNILQCRANDPGYHDCNSYNHAGVYCPFVESTCANGDIRLVGGESESEGRVEVCLKGAWGTVCHDRFKWGLEDARVVCNQLSYPPQGAALVPPGAYGPGEGPINFYHLTCHGSEQRLLQCTESPFVSFRCNHGVDAGVVCINNQVEVCVEGVVRLVGGATGNQGRVEVCRGNHFGTVCSEEWGSAEAQVVCSQLSYSTDGAVAVKAGFFRPGVGSIEMRNVSCVGTETSLLNCAHSGTGNQECSHLDDVGVICQLPKGECSHGEVRMVDGLDGYSGRVQVCVGGAWGTVCAVGWDSADAAVVCRSIGAEPTGARGTSIPNDGTSSVPVFLEGVSCNGTEEALIDCLPSSVSPGALGCPTLQDAGAICGEIACGKPGMRLEGGVNSYSGRLAVCGEGLEYGSVCGKDFSSKDANYVCAALGYAKQGGFVLSSAVFGEGRGAVYQLTTRCPEPSPSCMFDYKDISMDCGHESDVSLLCPVPGKQNCTLGDVRLAGSDSASRGRLEVCLYGQWGTVCDDAWSNQGAKVVCKQLKLPTEDARAVYGDSEDSFGPGAGPILLDDVKCAGDEEHVLSCPLSIAAHDCTHKEDVGVVCEEVSEPTAANTVTGRAGNSEMTVTIVVPVVVVIVLLLLVVVVIAVIVLFVRRAKRSDGFNFNLMSKKSDVDAEVSLSDKNL